MRGLVYTLVWDISYQAVEVSSFKDLGEMVPGSFPIEVGGIMTRKIAIFDTTLRDGEQSPGASMNAQEKLVIARQLLQLNVDVIEAGFPLSSPEDYRSVCQIAEMVGDRAVVCALSRAVDRDIEVAAQALQGAARPRIHTGLGVSPEHLREKLHMTEDQAVERAVHAVRLARNLCGDVEFYAEDAGRSDKRFLVRVIQEVVRAGATVVNIPDTTGYSLPDEFGQRIRYLFEYVDGLEDVTVSVHCHDDLGMATALTLEGVRNGATQVECTVNGLGERAGNTAIEEVVMAIRMHGQELDAYTDIDAHGFGRISRTVSSITGIRVQPNKAIVGANAFAHSSGIHQDGVIKARDTYEIIDPSDVGMGSTSIILTSRSGRAALRLRLCELGYHHLDESGLEELYRRFIQMADKKAEVYDEDLQALVDEHDREVSAVYTLKAVQVSCGEPLTPTATVRLIDREGGEHVSCTMGTGPIDAVYKAIDRIVSVENDLAEFTIQSMTRGVDALGEVTVRVNAPDGKVFIGRGADGDIIVSAAKAYLNALNRLLTKKQEEDR